MQHENENINEKKEKKSLFGPQIIFPLIIIIILAAFGVTIYYNNVIKPKNDIDKQAGYEIDKYIKLGDYKGLDLEITQDQLDESISEENHYEQDVNRAAREGDKVTINYTGYVDGKKDKNISENECELTIGSETDLYKTFADSVIGLKAKEIKSVDCDDATYVSEDKSDYSGKKVTFKIEVVLVSEPHTDEITDKWVKENYFDDYGFSTTKEFYEWIEDIILEDAVPQVWLKAVENAEMNGYPQELYDNVVEEYQADAAFEAEEWGMTVEELISDFRLLDEKGLNQEYLDGVKSELVMWAIVKEENITVNDDEIEEKYEELYIDCGYDSVEDMKVDYSKKEIKEAVYLDKAMYLVFDNASVKKTYKLPV